MKDDGLDEALRRAGAIAMKTGQYRYVCYRGNRAVVTRRRPNRPYVLADPAELLPIARRRVAEAGDSTKPARPLAGREAAEAALRQENKR